MNGKKHSGSTTRPLAPSPKKDPKPEKSNNSSKAKQFVMNCEVLHAHIKKNVRLTDEFDLRYITRGGFNSIC